MVRWTYGDAGDRYKVQPGDIWAVGDHRLGCADLEFGQVAEFCRRFGPWDIFYSDPPWNAGNAKAFRTKAAAETPSIATRVVDFPAFLGRILGLIVAAPARPNLVMMEMGVDTADALA